MTAHEVINYIKALPQQERDKVVDFVTRELRIPIMGKRTFEKASKRVFDRHAELMRKLSQ
jgi:hypothetical protein